MTETPDKDHAKENEPTPKPPISEEEKLKEELVEKIREKRFKYGQMGKYGGLL